MTEPEWLTSTDPGRMLASLRGKVSDRKLRLFACACCRGILHLVPDERCRWAIEAGERFADGLASQSELETARHEARAARPAIPPRGLDQAAARDWKAHWSMEAVAFPNAYWAAVAGSDRVAELAGQGVPAAESPFQCTILRCISGNHWRPNAIAPEWIAWNDGTIPKLAQAIYEYQAFDRLPILADALEDAGCADEQIVSHCRGPGPHARGCWVLDMVCGKS